MPPVQTDAIVLLPARRLTNSSVAVFVASDIQPGPPVKIKCMMKLMGLIPANAQVG